MGKIVDDLRAVVEALVALDVAALEDAELHDAVVGVERLRSRLGAGAARLVDEWDDRRVWAGDGSLTAAARLARETNTSAVSARAELRRARALRHMPATAAAAGGGRVSMDHVDLSGRARQPHRAELFAEHEPVLVELCARRRYRQAAQAVAQWEQLVDADGVEARGRELADAARLYQSTTFAGMVRLDGWLDPVGGEVVANELKRLEREQRLADEKAGRRRTAAQRRAAALVAMAARSAGAPGGSRRPLFTVAMGDDSFTGLCQLGSGTVIAPGMLLPWLGEAEIESILFDGRWPSACRSGDGSATPPAGRSRCATAIASTNPAVTCPPPTATSTTSPGGSRCG